jgi:hypothetical protein
MGLARAATWFFLSSGLIFRRRVLREPPEPVMRQCIAIPVD